MFPREYLPTQGRDDSSTAGVFQCTVLYHTIQYNTIQYNTIQYNTMGESIPPYAAFFFTISLRPIQSGTDYCSVSSTQEISLNYHGAGHNCLTVPTLLQESRGAISQSIHNVSSYVSVFVMFIVFLNITTTNAYMMELTIINNLLDIQIKIVWFCVQMSPWWW